MKSLKEVIEDRKSVRSFQKREVEEKYILDILDSARLAPSSKNKQPWRFRILSDSEKQDVIDLFRARLIEDNTEETGLATIKIMEECSKVVLVFMDYKEHVSSGHRLEPYYFSVGAAIENALLRATELGIGSLWVYDIVAIEKELEQMFAEGKMFISALLFGYEDKVMPRAKKKSLDEIIIR